MATFATPQGFERALDFPTLIRYRMISRLNLLTGLSIFRADILFCFLLIPVGLIVFVKLLPRRLRSPLFGLFPIFCIFVSYAEVKCLGAVGRLFSIDLLRDAIQWGWTDPTARRAYLKPSGLLHLLALMVSVIVIAWWAGKRSEAIARDYSLQQRWRKTILATALPLMAIVIPPWLSPPPVFCGNSILIDAVRAFWGWDEDYAAGREFRDLGPRELIQEYQDIGHVRPSKKDPRYWSKAADSDVLFFIFETGAAAMLPIAGDLEDLPNLRQLRERAFVAPFHYSTYPITSRALFSCFSAWYPSSLRNDFIDLYPGLMPPGIIRQLSARGYHSCIYAPYYAQPVEVKLPNVLGFEHVSFAHGLLNMASDIDKNPLVKKSYDLDALHLLEADARRWLSQGEHFVAVYVPQLGHHPWPDVHPDGRPKNGFELAHAIMGLQDAQLGELLRLLDSYHRLQKTLIVVVGDHGPRTREEYPDLPVGMIDDISFHVPMLLYAPQVLRSSASIRWVTSHIDLSPSLLDLLGVGRDRSLEQGSPIWDWNLEDRTTFFFGRHYLWADGYYSHGRFSMWNHFYDSVFQSNRQHFTSADEIARNVQMYDEVTGTIRRMVDLQQRWVAVFGPGEGHLPSSALAVK
jgi:hypothetical protein